MSFFTRPQSANAAIKIVRPTSSGGGEPEQPPSIKPPTGRKDCRPYAQYRYSRCHSPRAESPAVAPALSSPPTPTALTANAVNAPVFVPKFPVRIETALTPPPPASPSPPQYPEEQEQQQAVYDEYDEYMGYPAAGVDPVVDSMQEMAYASDPNYPGYDPAMDHAYFGTQAPVFVRQPLNYHLYTTLIPPSFVSSASDAHFIPPSGELRTLLQGRSEDLHTAPPPGLNLPEEMQGYHSLMPLENIGSSVERRKFGNWNSIVYRAMNSQDGGTYALRRIENFRLTHQAAFGAIEAWVKIRHPGVVAVHEAFTTHAFGDSSLVVAYAYHPQAQTLFDAHLKPALPSYQLGVRFQPPPPTPPPIPERTLWSYIVQLAAAIKSVHDAGQALRMIDVTKVLVTSKSRIRVSSCGVVDVLMYDTPQDMHLLQLEDLTLFGRLVFALCTGNVMASSGGNFQKSLEVMGRMYSPEIKSVALFLVNKGGPHKNIAQLMEIIGSRMAAEMADALSCTDILENELMGELENARLVRLLCKFGFINERPEFARDPRWSETGDRYIIKLFRDYVFHQVDENRNPSVNLSHVLSCLNKLDAGTDERIMLVSRDEQSCLVVSYKDIKACVQSAFEELPRAGTSSNIATGGGYR
ncbi:hypothetical protein GGX14DRAFT_428896 [Mycena pura]|uniref:PAN2-PAN3 deadenylation complex subunit PAN3 n=1 Tax=Mycena pura TaxID=153505 RepID=A0AAD7E0B7_9AGAR|nr:hypothetical protein GGX14DRAFT_428896 [Mycena pura]